MLCMSVMIPIYYWVILVLFSFMGVGEGGMFISYPKMAVGTVVNAIFMLLYCLAIPDID